MTRNFIAPSQKRPSVPWPAVFRRLGDDFSPQSPRKGPWRQESQCPFFACNEDWPVIFTSEVAPYSVGKMSVYLHVQIQKHMHQCTTMHNTPIPSNSYLCVGWEGHGRPARSFYPPRKLQGQKQGVDLPKIAQMIMEASFSRKLRLAVS